VVNICVWHCQSMSLKTTWVVACLVHRPQCSTADSANILTAVYEQDSWQPLQHSWTCSSAASSTLCSGIPTDLKSYRTEVSKSQGILLYQSTLLLTKEGRKRTIKRNSFHINTLCKAMEQIQCRKASRLKIT